MPTELPYFRYHPDPIATGAIELSEKVCICCDQARDYIYAAGTYAEAEIIESLCPWCIASGAAAQKFGASFSDDLPLVNAGIPQELIDEITKRTPGYVSWQSEEWLCHCGDVCEFHGDLSAEEVKTISQETIDALLALYDSEEGFWECIIKDYEPGGDPALYKFVCRHCRMVLLGWDMT